MNQGRTQYTPEDHWESVALATEGVDPFCSASDWCEAARAAWAPHLRPWIRPLEHGYLAFLVERSGLLRVLSPFDRMWGYSCPVLGTAAAAREAADEMLAETQTWHLALITGLARGSPLWNGLLASFRDRCALGVGEVQRRWQASLDGYWDRRSRKLRHELRRLGARAERAGVTVERADGDAASIYARILDIEARSWKGPADTGLRNEEMRAFYRELVKRLHARDRLRVRFARLQGEDIGYIAGGVIGDQYRGLQFSFDNRFRDLAPGNLMQRVEIDALIEEGFTVYDLGIDLPYKARWADTCVETTTLVIRRL
ncbi:MAG: GNAT family N-acetyltransferase [Planctomycetota bacterium]